MAAEESREEKACGDWARFSLGALLYARGEKERTAEIRCRTRSAKHRAGKWVRLARSKWTPFFPMTSGPHIRTRPTVIDTQVRTAGLKKKAKHMAGKWARPAGASGHRFFPMTSGPLRTRPTVSDIRVRTAGVKKKRQCE
jgi:hypothetical protein